MLDDVDGAGKTRAKSLDDGSRVVRAIVQEGDDGVLGRAFLQGKGSEAVGDAVGFIAHGNGDDDLRHG